MRSKAAEELVAEGMKKGTENGQARGAARSLLIQHEHKFGQVSEETRRRVCGATTQQLDLWTVRVLDAQRIDEVLEDAGG